MIRIFRIIRQKLAAENKAMAYSRYAIGEILLVVIGILIALQVNNWNEHRKQNIQKNLIVQSLVSDLSADTLMITKALRTLRQDTTEVMSFVSRMSDSHVTLGTLIQIARFEFDPKIYATVTFNDNTLKSLLSTGNLNILDKWMQDEILQLNLLHEDNISRTELNVQAYVNQVVSYEQMYPLSDYGNISPHSKLAGIIWNKVTLEELGTSLNALLSIRNVTDMYAIGQLNNIQEKTKKILSEITNSLIKGNGQNK
jgi:hypothetical protein